MTWPSTNRATLCSSQSPSCCAQLLLQAAVPAQAQMVTRAGELNWAPNSRGFPEFPTLLYSTGTWAAPANSITTPKQAGQKGSPKTSLHTPLGIVSATAAAGSTQAMLDTQRQAPRCRSLRNPCADQIAGPEFNITPKPWLGVQVNASFHQWLSLYKNGKSTTGKEKYKNINFFLFVALQFRRIFHSILLFLQGQWTQSQKSWSHRKFLQNFHAQKLHFTTWKHFPSWPFKWVWWGSESTQHGSSTLFYHFHEHLSQVLQRQHHWNLLHVSFQERNSKNFITESSLKFHSKRGQDQPPSHWCRKQKNERASEAVNRGNNCLYAIPLGKHRHCGTLRDLSRH